jgi:hypothetical protein
MLSAVMLIADMLKVVMLNVVILSVVASCYAEYFHTECENPCGILSVIIPTCKRDFGVRVRLG